MVTINRIEFKPLLGLFSKHLQTIIPTYSSAGIEPPSKNWIIDLNQGDYLACEVSTPPNWKASDPTVILIHGLGGSHSSKYMIRMARKSYLKGYKAIRVNLRGCGSGKGLSKLPYYAGASHDILAVIRKCKEEAPHSNIALIGFSLGANIVLKLAGELEEKASTLIHACFAICSPLDLAHSVQLIDRKRNHLYQRYYLENISKQAKQWMKQKVYSLYEFDNQVTAPLWGFSGADNYYHTCSSIHFLPKIQCKTHLLFAEDDPFIDLKTLNNIAIPTSPSVNIWATKYGGHMGFLGKYSKQHGFNWMDHLLLNWLDDEFKRSF